MKLYHLKFFSTTPISTSTLKGQTRKLNMDNRQSPKGNQMNIKIITLPLVELSRKEVIHLIQLSRVGGGSRWFIRRFYQLFHCNKPSKETRKKLDLQTKSTNDKLVKLYSKSKITLAKVNDKPIGWVVIDNHNLLSSIDLPSINYAQVSVYVKLKYRHHGIGKNLTEQSIRDFKKSRNNITLCATVRDQKTKQFFVKLGLNPAYVLVGKFVLPTKKNLTN